MSTALAQAPPSDATRQLYERHSSRIFGFCLSRLGSREEAEDAVQTTFLNAQRGLGRGVVPEYELAWLFKIAQNVCHNRHQSARRRGRVEATQDLDALQDVVASPDRSTAVSLSELTRALGVIPARQRRALLLREFQGYSYEEIGDELGVSVAAVETLLFRARRAVAEELVRTGATSRPRRGAAASVVELVRWLFGGTAAPLKLAAVTAAVATTATVSLVPDAARHKPAGSPVAPAALKAKARSLPAFRAARVPLPKIAHGTAAPSKVRVSEVQTAGPTVSAPAAAAGQGSAARPDVQSDSSPSPSDPVTATVPTLPVPDLPELPVLPEPTSALPAVGLPDLPLPAISVPDVQVPATPALPKLP
ncbi:MAG: hypothetical protein QOE13_2720 [Gaiellaceae bacterium]|nr:hypothetical protein [Gaiellaceae bacterium]